MLKRKKSKNATLCIITCAFVVVFFVINRNYLSVNNIRGIMYAVSSSGIIAIGIGCLLISGVVDLAAGAVGCISGVLVAILMQAGIAWPFALVATLLFGAIAGLINAFLTNVLNFMPFIATLGMASIWRALALIVGDGNNIAISQHGFYKITSLSPLGVPLPFIIMTFLFVVYGLILSWTPFGRSLYWSGGNRAASRLAGLKPKKITSIAFVNSGVLSALAGVIIASNNHIGSPTSVIGLEMDAIAAAVLGGISFMGGSGGMGGCFIALLMLNCISNGLRTSGLQPYWQIVAQGVLLLVALFIDYVSTKSRHVEQSNGSVVREKT